MGNPLLDTLGWIGSSLDKPGAAVRGLMAGRPDQLMNLLPFSDTLGITDPAQRTEGADLLGLDRDSLGGMVGGTAVNMATDPLNLLMGAGLARNLMRGRQMQGAYKGAQAGYEGELAAREALMPALEKAQTNNAMRQELLGTGGMPEEIAQKTLAVDASGNPVKTYHGTSQVFGKYDPAKDAQGLLYGPGYYTTESPAIASGYAGGGHPYSSVFDTGEAQHIQEELLRRGAQERGLPVPPLTPEGTMLRTEIPKVMQEWEQAGVPVEDVFKPYERHANVRTQFLDYRNPLNIEKVHTPEEIGALVDKLPLRRRAMLKDSMQLHPDILPREGMHGDTLYHTLLTGNPSKVAYAGQPALARDLQHAGYDAITHLGGGGRHQVHIVPRPEQIYSPWVAPLQMAEPALPGAFPPARPVPPRVSPLMASLLGQNVLGRAG